MQSRRLRDAAAILPMGGVLLFTPPFMRVFDQPVTLLGVPLLHVSLFVLWFVGLVLTAFVARALTRDIEEEEPAEAETWESASAPTGDGAGSVPFESGRMRG
jgi:hypothetical protein